MKFKSRRDRFFQFIVYGTCLFLLVLLIDGILNWNETSSVYVFIGVMSSVILLLLWIFHDTSYYLNEKEFKYRMAFFKGKIPIKNIVELEIGTTMWVGFKPATARNGIVLKYNKYDEIYLSPDSNESFVAKMKELNPEVKITGN